MLVERWVLDNFVQSPYGERAELAGPARWQYATRKLLARTVIRMDRTEEPGMGVEPEPGTRAPSSTLV